MNVHHNPNTVHRGMYMNSTVPMTPGGPMVKVAMVDRRHQRCNHPAPLMTPVTHTGTNGVGHCTLHDILRSVVDDMVYDFQYQL